MIYSTLSVNWGDARAREAIAYLDGLEADREILRAYGKAMVENGRGIGAAWCLPEVQERALALVGVDPR